MIGFALPLFCLFVIIYCNQVVLCRVAITKICTYIIPVSQLGTHFTNMSCATTINHIAAAVVAAKEGRISILNVSTSTSKESPSVMFDLVIHFVLLPQHFMNIYIYIYISYNTVYCVIQ